MRASRKSIPLLLLVAVGACARAPVPPADTSEADAAAIRATNDRWIASFNDGDAAALSLTYLDDAVALPPDGPLLVGRQAIVQSLRDYFAEFSATQASTVAEVTLFGDLAMARGTWKIRQTPRPDGVDQLRSGKWLALQKRQADGTWKTWRWIWNQDVVGN